MTCEPRTSSGRCIGSAGTVNTTGVSASTGAASAAIRIVPTTSFMSLAPTATATDHQAEHEQTETDVRPLRARRLGADAAASAAGLALRQAHALGIAGRDAIEHRRARAIGIHAAALRAVLADVRVLAHAARAELVVGARVTELAGRRIPEALAGGALLAGEARRGARARGALHHGHGRAVGLDREVVVRLRDAVDHAIGHIARRRQRVVRRDRLAVLAEGGTRHGRPQVIVEPQLDMVDAAARAGSDADGEARRHRPGRGRQDHRRRRGDDRRAGAAADDAWHALLTCVQEVYSPFAVTGSDVPPSNGVSYTMGIAAGNPSDVGLPNDILGVGLATCAPLANEHSFSFSNHETGSLLTRMYDACWTSAQETAHNFGLEHEYQFTDGNSACSDPMTYRTDCGGEKFFRNRPAACGEYSSRTCSCGSTQNSVSKLTKALGADTTLIPAPTSMILPPAAGPVSAGFTVGVAAGSRRGVDHVEQGFFYHLWEAEPGAAFGQNGQPNPSNYTLTAPSNVPDGVIDVVAK